VWSNQVEHRVDVRLNLLTSSLAIDLDGATILKRGMRKMGLSGSEIPFQVDGRPCLLVIRQRYGDAPEIELYSDGRSLTTGEPLADRREAHGREIPNLVRMLLIFLPLIAVPSVLRPLSARTDPAPDWFWYAIVAVGVALAAAGWWLARRWYSGGPDRPNRHLVGGAIVAVAYVAFLVVFGVSIALSR
jgi:hypothetical protein